MILKKYKNELFTVLETSGVSIDSFEVKNETKQNMLGQEMHTFKILLIDSPLYFTVIESPLSFDQFGVTYIKFAPKFSEFDSAGFLVQADDFDTVKNKFMSWLNSDILNYLDDKNGFDLWKDYFSHNINFTKINYQDLSKFTAKEREQVKIGLDQFKISLITKITFDSRQLEAIGQRIKYLSEAVDRLDKTDWKSIAISTILSLITALSVDTNTGKLIIDLFKKSFQIVPKLPF